jgi:cysteinyl-tRNA synthetase
LRNWQSNIANVEPLAVDEEFLESLSDDLNTHGAFTRLHQLNKQKEFSTLKASLLLMGFKLDFEKTSEIDRDAIVDLINDRLLARHTKNWKESDRLRDVLASMGVAIKDNPDGTTTWEMK